MKVLVSAYACEPGRGSEPGFGWNWATGINKMGHEVWCFTTPRGKQAIEKAIDGSTYSNLHFIYVPVPKFIDRFYYSFIGPYLHYLVWQYLAYKEAKKLDQKTHFDLIHHVTYGSLQQATFLWRLKKPLIFGPVGGGQFPPSAFKKYFLHGWRAEVIRKYISSVFMNFNPNLKPTIKNARVVLTANQETFELAKKYGATNPQYFLDTSLPEDFYPPSIPVRAPGPKLKILWVGRLFPRKGLPLVLEALSKVKNIPYSLTIIGDGSMRTNIEKQITMLNLQDKVEVKGQIPWEKVKDAYMTHDVFMFTSLRDSFGAQLMEAMAYGLPIITLNLHGAGTFVPESAGIKVPANNPEETLEALKQAVERMYNHPEERVQFGKSAYDFARKHSWPAKVASLTEYYH